MGEHFDSADLMEHCCGSFDRGVAMPVWSLRRKNSCGANITAPSSPKYSEAQSPRAARSYRPPRLPLRPGGRPPAAATAAAAFHSGCAAVWRVFALHAARGIGTGHVTGRHDKRERRLAAGRAGPRGRTIGGRRCANYRSPCPGDAAGSTAARAAVAAPHSWCLRACTWTP